jgi:hypothetical protein
VAAQSVLVAFLLCAANLRKIDAYMAEEEAAASGSLRRLPPRRISRSIEQFLPKRTEVATAEGSPPGPDPPVIA